MLAPKKRVEQREEQGRVSSEVIVCARRFFEIGKWRPEGRRTSKTNNGAFNYSASHSSLESWNSSSPLDSLSSSLFLADCFCGTTGSLKPRCSEFAGIGLDTVGVLV